MSIFYETNLYTYALVNSKNLFRKESEWRLFLELCPFRYLNPNFKSWSQTILVIFSTKKI